MSGSLRRLTAAGCVAIAVAAASPATAIDDAAVRAARYLAAQQKPSGAFFTSDARADGVAEVVASLVAAGVGGASIERALAYIRAHGPAVASEPAYAARIVLGIVAAGGNPRHFGGVDYVAKITPDSNGSYYSNLYGHAIAVLGLIAAGAPVPPQAIEHIRDHQCRDGGFAYNPNCASAGDVSNALKGNVDTTSLVLCIFVALRVPPGDEARLGARSFLVSAANEDRGYGEYAGRATSANSTGLVLSAIAALGESPSAAPWADGGRNPLRALRAMQLSSGAFPPNDYATIQAVPGLAAAAYPVRPRARVSGGRTNIASSTSASSASASVPTSPAPVASTSAFVAPAPSEASIAAAAPPPPDPQTQARGVPGLAVGLAVAGCAGAAEAFRRVRRRWSAAR